MTLYEAGIYRSLQLGGGWGNEHETISSQGHIKLKIADWNYDIIHIQSLFRVTVSCRAPSQCISLSLLIFFA